MKKSEVFISREEKMDEFERTKLYEVIRSLTKRQRKDFVAFIEVPSLNLKDYEIKVCRIVIDEVEKKNFTSITKKKIILRCKAFKKEISTNWNYIKSNLLKAVYRYLMFNQNSPDKMPYGFSLLQYFRSNNLPKNSASLFSKLNKNLTREIVHNNNSHYYNYLLLQLNLEDFRLKRKDHNVFKLYRNSLDDFYLENNLRILCEAVNRSEIINSKRANFELDFWESKIDFREHPSRAIRIFYRIYILLTDVQNEEYFFEIKKDLLSIDHIKFSQNDHKTVFEYLLNYCIIKFNKHKIQWAHEYIRIIKILEEKEILLESNIISFSKYKNSITAGLVLGEIEWVEQFAKTYQEHIPREEKNDIHQYNSANIEFHKNKFEKALEELVGFHSSDFYYQISYRKLLLKIYYELSKSNQEYVEAIDRSISSFTKFIRDRQNLSTNNQKLLLSFISYFKILMRSQKLTIDDVRGKIPLSDFIWFKEKLDNNQ